MPLAIKEADRVKNGLTTSLSGLEDNLQGLRHWNTSKIYGRSCLAVFLNSNPIIPLQHGTDDDEDS